MEGWLLVGLSKVYKQGILAPHPVLSLCLGGGAEFQSLPLVLHKTKLSNTEGSEMTLGLPYYVLHFSLHRAKCNADIQNVGGRVVIVSCIHT